MAIITTIITIIATVIPLTLTVQAVLVIQAATRIPTQTTILRQAVQILPLTQADCALYDVI